MQKVDMQDFKNPVVRKYIRIITNKKKHIEIRFEAMSKLKETQSFEAQNALI